MAMGWPTAEGRRCRDTSHRPHCAGTCTRELVLERLGRDEAQPADDGRDLNRGALQVGGGSAMEVCYAYSGIGRVIMEMTASDWAAWFGAIGTMLATGVAVWLYWKSKKDAQKDKAARRTVLM